MNTPTDRDTKKAHIIWREQDKSSKSFIPVTLHFPMSVNEIDVWKSRVPQNEPFKKGQCSAISRYTADDECVRIFHLHFTSTEIQRRLERLKSICDGVSLQLRTAGLEHDASGVCLTVHDQLPVILSQEAKSPGCASWHLRLFKIKVLQPIC